MTAKLSLFFESCITERASIGSSLSIHAEPGGISAEVFDILEHISIYDILLSITGANEGFLFFVEGLKTKFRCSSSKTED